MPRSGLYDRAYRFLLFPLLQINAPLARVMLPTLARLRTDEQRYRSAYLQAVNQLLLVTQPGIVFAIADRRHLCPDPARGEVACSRADLPVDGSRGLAAADQRRDELAVHQSRAKQSFAWSGAFNAAISTVAFCVGLPWGPIGVAAAYSISQVSIAVAGRVVDGDANRAGAAARSLWPRDDPCSGERRVIYVDRGRAPSDDACRHSRSRTLSVPLLRDYVAGAGDDAVRPDDAAR